MPTHLTPRRKVRLFIVEWRESRIDEVLGIDPTNLYRHPSQPSADALLRDQPPEIRLIMPDMVKRPIRCLKKHFRLSLRRERDAARGQQRMESALRTAGRLLEPYIRAVNGR